MSAQRSLYHVAQNE